MARLFEPPRNIAIEGPIRVGKSTLARVLAETLGACRIAEPENNPFLDRFYRNEAGMGFAAQMWFLYERYHQLSTMPEAVAQPIVSDYIFEKDKLFACINLTDTELATYNHYYNHFRKHLPTPDLVIYLKAPPEVLQQRLKRKGLPGERDVSEKYIAQVAAAYEHFFFHYSASDLLVVDTSDLDFVRSNHDLQLLLQRLAEPIHGRQYLLPLGAGHEAE
jgi:deoxyadenosine/deoxycytidine kinase